jgi:hypothetical protein
MGFGYSDNELSMDQAAQILGGAWNWRLEVGDSNMG